MFSLLNTNTKFERFGNALVKWGIVLKLAWEGVLADMFILIIVLTALGVDGLAAMGKSFKEKKLNGDSKPTGV